MVFSSLLVSIDGAALEVYQVLTVGQGLASGEYGGMIDWGNNVAIIPCFCLGESVIIRCTAAAD